MKKTKKIALILMTVVFMAVCCVFGASAEETLTDGYYSYTVTDGEATITSVDNSISGDIVIPSTLGGYPVKSIIGTSTEEGPFCNCMGITSVTIPYGIEIIKNSFYRCGELLSVSFPESLLEIDRSSFSTCVKLKEVVIPGSLKTAEGFLWCSSLQKVTFLEGVEEIAADAFTCAYNLKEIEFPESLEKIGKDAFNGCVLLKDVEIPENVTYIGEGVFRECLSLEKIIVLSENVEFGEKSMAYTGILLKDTTPQEYANLMVAKDFAWIEMYKALLAKNQEEYNKNYEIYKNCEDEQENSFVLCNESIVIENVTMYGKIGSTAEAYANENGIDFEEIVDVVTSGSCGENVTWNFDEETGALTISGTGAMTNYNSVSDVPWYSFADLVKSVKIESGVTTIGDISFVLCENLSDATISDTVTIIGKQAFYACYSLSDLTIGNGVKTLDYGAFWSCGSLKTVNIPDSVETVAEYAFYQCRNLENVTMGKGVVSIGPEAFFCCENLKSITLPESLKNIGMSAFHENVSLSSVYYTGTEEQWNNITIDAGNEYLLAATLIFNHNNHTCSFGDWFTETEATLFSEGVSKRVCECGKYETKLIAKLESASAKDENTKVEVTYTEENFDSEIKIVVSEEEINANIVFGDEYENYKAFDISIEANGEKVQPEGYVTVKLPLPEGFNAETTKVYYVDENGNKEEIESTVEDDFVIFETDHFSEYVLVDESSKHEHNYTSAVTKAPTCTENGTTTYSCSCGDSYTEAIPSTGHSHNKVVTAPTCTSKGYTTYTCSCGDSYVADYVNAKGHKDSNGDYKCDNGCGYEFEKPAEPEQPEVPEDPSENCSCNCHKTGFMGFIWKIINFFQKLFKINPVCSCGAAHY